MNILTINIRDINIRDREENSFQVYTHIDHIEIDICSILYTQCYNTNYAHGFENHWFSDFVRLNKFEKFFNFLHVMIILNVANAIIRNYYIEFNSSEK